MLLAAPIFFLSFFLMFQLGLLAPTIKSAANDYVLKIFRKNQLLKLSNYLVDYAHVKGALFIDKENPHQFGENGKLKADNLSNHFSVTMPMTLFPSPYPAELYLLAKHLQPLMAEVHLRVSRDYNFIKKNMSKVAEADPEFIGEMVKIMDAVKDKRRQSGMTLILQRSDYLTHLEKHPHGHTTTINLKQIEVSSGANSGQGDSELATKVHQRVLDKLRYMMTNAHQQQQQLPDWFPTLNVEKNDVLQGQAEALFQTWLRFSEMHNDPRAVILLVSAPKRRAHSHFHKLNWAQFRLEDVAMEYEKQRERERKEKGKTEKRKYYRPHLVQITIKECADRKRVELDEDNHLILLNEMGEHRRVAVAVFMDHYLPEHFPTEKEWKMRLQFEQSEAVIQPNVFVYFAGTKTIQQALTKKDALESFFPESKLDTPKARELAMLLAQLRSTFIEQWALGSDSAEEKALIDRAIAKPDEYVLKSNRQAGKGNLFGQDIADELKKLMADQRGEYVLQKKIHPFYVKNIIVPIAPLPETQLDVLDVNSEISIYGSLLARTLTEEELAERTNAMDNYEYNQHGDQDIVVNSVNGHGVRTKILSNTMCTISGGKGGIDSLVLFDMDNFQAISQSMASIGTGEEENGGGGGACAAAGEQFAIEEEGPANGA